jgi:hypothetical protein
MRHCACRTCDLFYQEKQSIKLEKGHHEKSHLRFYRDNMKSADGGDQTRTKQQKEPNQKQKQKNHPVSNLFLRFWYSDNMSKKFCCVEGQLCFCGYFLNKHFNFSLHCLYTSLMPVFTWIYLSSSVLWVNTGRYAF